MARMHEAPKYFTWVMQVAGRDRPAASPSTPSPTEHASGKGFGSTEAARGALSRLDRHRGRQDRELPGRHPDGLEHRPAGRRQDEAGPIEAGPRRLADRRHGRPGRARPCGPQLRLLPGLHGARLRRQDRARSCPSSSSMGWSELDERLSPGTSSPYQLLDDGFDPDSCQLLVIGCGNLLRGDDAVGPVADPSPVRAAACPPGSPRRRRHRRDGRRLRDARRRAGGDRGRRADRRRAGHRLSGAGRGARTAAAHRRPAHPHLPLGPRAVLQRLAAGR